MTCAEVEALIHRELDGELLDAEARSLREHVETCPRCAALRDGLHEVLATARELACAPAEEAGRPASTPDLVASVTRSLRRRRQLRLALVGGLAVAAGLLLLILGTWQSTPLAKPLLPTGVANLVPRPATGQGAVAPFDVAQGGEPVEPQADFVNRSLNEGLAWVEEAWQRTQEEVTGLAQPAAAGEEAAPASSEGSWWEEVGATGDALQQITYEVSKRILPVEVPYLNETSEEQEKV